MTTTETPDTAQDERTLQVYRVYIKVAPEEVWQAITDPEWNARYGYGAPQYFELRPGGSYRSTASEEMRKVSDEMGYGIPDVVVDGEVLEADPPRRLVQTFRMPMSPTRPPRASPGSPTRSPGGPRRRRLTVTHEVTGAPNLAAVVAGAYEDQGAGWRRLGLDPQRPQVAAGDRLDPRRLRAPNAVLAHLVGSWLAVDREPGPRMIRSPGVRRGARPRPAAGTATRPARRRRPS